MNIIKYIYEQYLLKRHPIKLSRKMGVEVGEGCRFLSLNKGTFGSEPFLVSIGNHVTITSGVRFITHDGGVWVFRQSEPEIDVFGKIEIGNNVFIGINTIIMPNVKVGDNVVIGAGSIVTKDVESNTVVVGVPAKKINSIDSYRDKLKGKESFIKGKSKEEKKKILQEKFNENE